jgi:1,4-alpha-glucan branching enzyme
MIVFERAGLLFAFNFNPTQSFADYRVGVDVAGEYECVLSSDEGRFGGWGNVKEGGRYRTTALEWNGRKNWTQVSVLSVDLHGFFIDFLTWSKLYIPSRTCIVLAKVN